MDKEESNAVIQELSSQIANSAIIISRLRHQNRQQATKIMSLEMEIKDLTKAAPKSKTKGKK